MHPFRTPASEFSKNGQPVAAHPPSLQPNYHTHVLLFLMTVVTTTAAGMVFENLNPISDLRLFYRGLPYAGTLLTILFAHEMGHYLTARYFHMNVTLPYFIPAPPPFFLGTLGAFIRMKSPAGNRRSLLYVAAAGPIAGFCVALPAIIYAYATSSVAPLQQTDSGLFLGEPLLLWLVEYVVVGPVPAGSALHINSVGVAAWFGLLVTMLNLMPIGQFDGGHIVYAIFGRKSFYISRIMIGVLLMLGLIYDFPGWFVWAFLGWLTSRRHPVIIDHQTPLTPPAQRLAVVALAIFILCFMPKPISIGVGSF
jgi:membrane-associated protease RseP (regulator of RpoE activity)